MNRKAILDNIFEDAINEGFASMTGKDKKKIDGHIAKELPMIYQIIRDNYGVTQVKGVGPDSDDSDDMEAWDIEASNYYLDKLLTALPKFHKKHTSGY